MTSRLRKGPPSAYTHAYLRRRRAIKKLEDQVFVWGRQLGHNGWPDGPGNTLTSEHIQAAIDSLGVDDGPSSTILDGPLDWQSVSLIHSDSMVDLLAEKATMNPVLDAIITDRVNRGFAKNVFPQGTIDE